jgi:putative intracellular protease/amidase
MSDYWPDGIDLNDVASPLEILKEAAKGWSEKSGGTVELLIQPATSKSNYDMLLVHGKHVPSGRTVSLFSVVYRPGAPYPARLQLDDEDLPDLFKKVYYQPGPLTIMGAMASMAGNTEGRQVTNKWVCDVPSEFRTKLRNAFNEGGVKTKILNLIAVPKQVEQPKPDIEPASDA